MKPKLSNLKTVMLGLASMFGADGLALVIFGQDLLSGLWLLAVCVALMIGVVPSRLSGNQSTVAKDASEPDNYALLPD